MSQQLLIAIIGVVGTIVVTLITVNRARKSQKELSAKDMLEMLQTQINDLGDKVRDVETANRILQDYVHELRDHISQQKPPPPPTWPEFLRK